MKGKELQSISFNETSLLGENTRSKPQLVDRRTEISSAWLFTGRVEMLPWTPGYLLSCLFFFSATTEMKSCIVVEILENCHVLEDNISGFRKGHSTTSVLLSIRDDILDAMNRSEYTLLVLANFSKAFDTVKSGKI